MPPCSSSSVGLLSFVRLRFIILLTQWIACNRPNKSQDTSLSFDWVIASNYLEIGYVTFISYDLII